MKSNISNAIRLRQTSVDRRKWLAHNLAAIQRALRPNLISAGPGKAFATASDWGAAQPCLHFPIDGFRQPKTVSGEASLKLFLRHLQSARQPPAMGCGLGCEKNRKDTERNRTTLPQLFITTLRLPARLKMWLDWNSNSNWNRLVSLSECRNYGQLRHKSLASVPTRRKFYKFLQIQIRKLYCKVHSGLLPCNYFLQHGLHDWLIWSIIQNFIRISRVFPYFHTTIGTPITFITIFKTFIGDV